jgi:hypothetical protein
VTAVPTVPYCTLDEVYLLGLSAQAFVTRARPYDAVNAATATIRLKAHGLSALDVVTFEVTGGGALPTGVSAFVAYTPIVVSSDLFQITGFASWASAGSGWGIAVDPARRLAAHILEVSAEIDEHLTADEPPLTAPYPRVVVGLAARMVARAAVLSLQVENAAYRVAVDRLFERQTRDQEMLDAWKAGKPINPRPTDQTDAPDNGARASNSRDPDDWTIDSL